MVETRLVCCAAEVADHAPFQMADLDALFTPLALVVILPLPLEASLELSTNEIAAPGLLGRKSAIHIHVTRGEGVAETHASG